MSNLNIIYEDENVIVVDKPAGIAVHPIEKNKGTTSPTIAGLVVRHYPGIKTVGKDPLRPGIVHRLDKETSGLMVVAKNNEAFFELKKLFKEREVEKKYIALLSGMLEKDNGVITTPLTKIGTRATTARTTASDVNGQKKIKEAITRYKVLKHFKEYTLVEVKPETGRMHQIRVHFASINHPLACDKLYGRKSKKCPPGLNRHFLHASYLKFCLKNALMEFGSPLPKNLAKTLDELPK